MTWLVVVCASLAVAALVPSVPPTARRAAPASASAPALRRVAVAGVAIGAWLFVGGTAGVLVAAVAAVLARQVLAAAEAPSARREREEVERTLPHLVDLFAATLRAGSEPLSGLARVCAALPGPAADRLVPVVEQARWGAAGVEAWSVVADDQELAPLARAMVRSQVSGASVVQSVERLADELQRESLARAEDAARQVGVAAAIPLGACLLPAFMLLGVVPTVASLFGSVTP